MSTVADEASDSTVQQLDGPSTLTDGPLPLSRSNTMRTIGPLKLRAKHDDLPQYDSDPEMPGVVRLCMANRTLNCVEGGGLHPQQSL